MKILFVLLLSCLFLSCKDAPSDTPAVNTVQALNGNWTIKVTKSTGSTGAVAPSTVRTVWTATNSTLHWKSGTASTWEAQVHTLSTSNSTFSANYSKTTSPGGSVTMTEQQAINGTFTDNDNWTGTIRTEVRIVGSGVNEYSYLNCNVTGKRN